MPLPNRHPTLGSSNSRTSSCSTVFPIQLLSWTIPPPSTPSSVYPSLLLWITGSRSWEPKQICFHLWRTSILPLCLFPRPTPSTPPVAVSKACVQACYLSGRARVEALSRHWDLDNKDGSCLLCKSVKPTLGNLEHFLLSGGCPALVEAILTMLSFFQAYMVSRPYLLPVLKACWDVDDTTTMQFLLDCSVLPIIIKFSQEAKNNIQEDLFYMTRSYIFKVQLTRRRLLENMKAVPY